MKTLTLTLAVAVAVFMGAASTANASLVAWYFYGDNLDNALDSSVTLNPGFAGSNTSVGTSETYADANGSGATITVDGFRNNFSTAATVLENFRNANDIGHGISGGTSTGELDGASGTEMLRYTLDTSLTDYTVYVSSVDGQEGVEFATSNSASPGSLTWEFAGRSGVHSAGDGDGGATEVVNGISLDTLFGAGNLGAYLFVREEVGYGGSNDDILVMQMSAQQVIPEPTTIVVWSLLGLTAGTCWWRRKCRA